MFTNAATNEPSPAEDASCIDTQQRQTSYHMYKGIHQPVPQADVGAGSKATAIKQKQRLPDFGL